MYVQTGCVEGYRELDGDIPGWGTVWGRGGGESVSSCTECANLCNSVADCHSYECSDTELKCNLNAQRYPGCVDRVEDYYFCAEYPGPAITTFTQFGEYLSIWLPLWLHRLVNDENFT